MLFTTKPVRVLRSTDVDAPQLPYNVKGSLKTVLKAALVTGYGQTESLGWEALFEDDYKIALRSSDSTSTQCVLRVDDNYNYSAKIIAYESMTDIDTGYGGFETNNNAYNDKYYMRSPKTATKKAQWVIVGHDTAFWLCVWNNYDTHHSTKLFFGDFASFKAGDSYNCALIADLNNNDFAGIYPLSPGLSSTSNTYYGGYLSVARLHDQIYKSTTGIAVLGDYKENNASYPDLITGGWVGWDAYITEDAGIRGVLPGVKLSSNFITSDIFGFGETLPKVQQTADDFIWVRQEKTNNSAAFVVNTSAWIAP